MGANEEIKEAITLNTIEENLTLFNDKISCIMNNVDEIILKISDTNDTPYGCIRYAQMDEGIGLISKLDLQVKHGIDKADVLNQNVKMLTERLLSPDVSELIAVPTK